jgi:Kef-type K+ transport system membrane component KefB
MIFLATGLWMQAVQATGSSMPTIPLGLLPQVGLDTSFVATFCLFVAILLLWTTTIGLLCKKFFNLPVIAGQIIAGIVLGPSVFNIARVAFFAQSLTLVDHVTYTVYTLIASDLFVFFIMLVASALTVPYLLWIAGHETNVTDVAKVGGVAIVAGLLGAVVPIMMITALYYTGIMPWHFVHYVSIGLIFSATSVSIPVAMLCAFNKMHLKSSKATLGAAVIDDIIAVILLSIFFLYVQAGLFGNDIVRADLGNVHTTSIGYAMGCLVAAFTFLMVVGYYVVAPFIRWLDRNQYDNLFGVVATGVMLLYFAGAELMGGLAGITGAYFAGLFHRMGDARHLAEKSISPFVNAILLPLFLGSIGLQVNIGSLSFFDWGMVLVLLVCAIVSKFIGCAIATAGSTMLSSSKMGKWTALETYLFSSSMVARGEVGLVISTILYGLHIIEPNQYGIVIVVIVLTTVITPIMLAAGFAHEDALIKK